MEALEKAREFIARNARPIDLARWNYLFENGEVNSIKKAFEED
ncbi:MAG: hypothetical protein PHI98_08325 [Eubacteriales bacterium]|nr:hypothetical protein [Eubacteriales bacterium]